MSYVWQGSSPLRRGDDRIEPGEEFSPTEAEKRSFSDLMDEVEAPTRDETPGVEATEPVEEADEEEAEAEDDTDSEYVCGVELSSGGECSREVDAPDATCFQH